MEEKDKKNIDAITLDFDYRNRPSEIPLAKKTAKKNNINHKIFKITLEEKRKLTMNFFKKMDSPTNDGLNNYLISYFAKKNKSKVIMSGVGADEVFFGYKSFKRLARLNNFVKLTKKIPFFKSLSALYKYLLSNKHINPKLKFLLSYGDEIKNSYTLQRAVFLPEEIEEISYTTKFLKNYVEEFYENNFSYDIEKLEDTNIQIMYLEIMNYLVPKLLRDSDWVSMDNSVELRTPYVDWHFFNNILPLLKSNILVTKKNLAVCKKNRLPKEIFSRKKTGFDIPYNEYSHIISDKSTVSASPIRNWTILSYKNYLINEK